METTYLRTFQMLFVGGPFTVSLDRMEAALAILGAQGNAKSVAVQNPVPQFVFSTTPAVLVTVDGEPAWRRVTGAPFERILNTRPLVLRDGTGTVYFHLFDGFLKAPGLAGPSVSRRHIAGRLRQGGLGSRRERRGGPDGGPRRREDG